MKPLQIFMPNDSFRSMGCCRIRFSARDDRFASKGLERVSIVFPLGARVSTAGQILRRMLSRCRDSYFGHGGNESQWNIISRRLLLQSLRTHTHIYRYCRSYVATVGTKLFSYKSYYYIVSKNRFLADKIILHPSLFVSIGS